MRRLCRWIARLAGWSFDTQLPTEKHFVLIGYPHTSNWDFVLAMLFKTATGLPFNWVAKHSLFVWPLGKLMRAMGGIGVDRDRTQGFIGQLAEEFQRRETMMLAITPEGTRSHTHHLRSGFYHLAMTAKVPVVLGYVCYETKRMGIGPTLYLSGDQEADLDQIRNFYADKVGRFPEQAGEIKFRLD
jgi:1-acyl-sn-glycerol-3-phosphate acyltransferase